jgi:hypothetical protein
MNLFIGTILAYYGDERTFDATGDFLICNGSTLQKKQYPDLFFHLSKISPELIIDGNTFKLPNLKSEFLRGCDDVRKVGTIQNESIKKQDVEFSVLMQSGCSGSSKGLDGGPNRFVKGTEVIKFSIGDGTETRPCNIAVNWIIKAK